MLFFKVLGRLIGRFFTGIGQVLGGIFRIIRRNELTLGVIVVLGLIIGGIYLLLTALNINIVIGQPQTVSAPAVVTAAPSPTPAPQPTAVPQAVTRSNAPDATEKFMRGQVTFDANQIWDAMGAELHTALQSRGRDKASIERDFQSLKTSGVQYETYQYVGGYKAPEGESIHFYVVRLRDGDNKATERSYTFRLDNDGKIASFISS